MDLAQVGISAMLVAGAFVNAFGMGAWLVGASPGVAWTFWLIGFGLWVVALGIFFSFMDSPLPRHSRRR